jgi:hypothetical protein
VLQRRCIAATQKPVHAPDTAHQLFRRASLTRVTSTAPEPTERRHPAGLATALIASFLPHLSPDPCLIFVLRSSRNAFTAALFCPRFSRARGFPGFPPASHQRNNATSPVSATPPVSGDWVSWERLESVGDDGDAAANRSVAFVAVSAPSLCYRWSCRLSGACPCGTSRTTRCRILLFR